MAMMTENALEYPVLCVGKESNLHFARKADELLVCSKKAFNSGFYEELNIFDSIGNNYCILSTRQMDTVGHFWGFSLWKGQRISVTLTMKILPEKQLSTFKEYVLNLLKNNDFFNSKFEIKGKIIETNSYYGIINILADAYYKQY